jgi:hypothetical protein
MSNGIQSAIASLVFVLLMLVLGAIKRRKAGRVLAGSNAQHAQPKTQNGNAVSLWDTRGFAWEAVWVERGGCWGAARLLETNHLPA